MGPKTRVFSYIAAWTLVNNEVTAIANTPYPSVACASSVSFSSPSELDCVVAFTRRFGVGSGQPIVAIVHRCDAVNIDGGLRIVTEHTAESSSGVPNRNLFHAPLMDFGEGLPSFLASLIYAEGVNAHSRPLGIAARSGLRRGERRIVMLSFGFILATFVSFASDRTLEDESSSTIIFRKIAVSGEKLEEQYVVQRSREFLAKNKDKKLIRYTLVPDEPGATIGAIGCDHCKPYPFWRIQYDAVAREAFPIGEMIAFGGNAVLRYRSRNGTVTETVLTGANPRPIAIGGFRGQIVHVGMEGRIQGPILWLRLYVVGNGEIRSEAGADYIAGFSRQMGVRYSTVEFRSDPWFINEIWRPWFPLFEENRGVPPNEQQFSATKTVSCKVFSRLDSTTNECSWKGVASLP